MYLNGYYTFPTQDVCRPEEHFYVPYSNQRQAQDFVHWDSILSLVPGEMRGSSWEMHL